MFLLVWIMEMFEIIWIFEPLKATQNIGEFTACLNQLNPHRKCRVKTLNLLGVGFRCSGTPGDLTCVFRGFVVLCLWVCAFVGTCWLADIKYCFIASLFVLGGVMFLLLMVDVLHFIQSVYFAWRLVGNTSTSKPYSEMTCCGSVDFCLPLAPTSLNWRDSCCDISGMQKWALLHGYVWLNPVDYLFDKGTWTEMVSEHT